MTVTLSEADEGSSSCACRRISLLFLSGIILVHPSLLKSHRMGRAFTTDSRACQCLTPTTTPSWYALPHILLSTVAFFVLEFSYHSQ